MPGKMPRQGDSVTTESKSAMDTRAREALILGKPPRIPPLQHGELSREAVEEVLTLRKAVSLPPSEDVPEFTATMLRHPTLNRRVIELGLQLFGGALAPRDRELAVLRTAWLCKAPYEWGEHVAIAKRVAGLTQEEIERVTHGSAAPGWNEDDRAILRAAEELHGDAMISDETWSVLSRRLDEKQLIELPILIGQYHGIAYVQNALRARLIADNPGLTAR